MILHLRMAELGHAKWVSEFRYPKGGISMKGSPIFIILFAILLILWLGGFLVFHVASAMIHLLLICAFIALILHFVSGRATT